ncbi:tetratricopeptide repeat protein [Actinophytocola gossypii]|uniref:ATP-binding protein n=1 Tax=Actinophytocola gossypii TaxID=2812003 RepID=A0ABT2JJR2_9PSEU|nr:tetratricopeptide repeat protein [Actinophytocola gossypii]MCT2588111.1 ATP-binding protein [Actinophytocola gossypii]
MRRHGSVRSVRDPVTIGVHRAVGGTPPYVRRDRHDELVDLLRPGRFALVVGDAAAGKSRLAWAATSAALGRHRLFAPAPTDLAATVAEMATARRAVLWLDDLDRFLDVLTPGTLDDLLVGGHRVAVATMRRHEYELLTTESDRTLAECRHRLLATAELIHLAPAFSAAELARARRVPALADALAHTDRLPEHLAGGPRLLARWRDGTHPRGAALVSAAVDCRRAGFRGPLPVALLDEVQARYQPGESTADAWAWATEPDPSPLLARDGDTVTVFDYLVDHTQRTHPFDPVPDEVLRTALRHAGTTDARSMGHAAGRAGRYQLALEMHARTLDDPIDTPADLVENLSRRNSHAAILGHLGRHEEALACHRDVLDARRHLLGPDHPDTLVSRTNVGVALNALGRYEAALTEHRGVLSTRNRLLGPDHPDTLTSRDHVAAVLNNLGRQDEALTAHRAELDACVRVLGATHPDTLVSRHNLAAVLMGMGRFREAATELRDVLSSRRHILGPDHPDTRTSRTELIAVMLENARYG